MKRFQYVGYRTPGTYESYLTYEMKVTYIMWVSLRTTFGFTWTATSCVWPPSCVALYGHLTSSFNSFSHVEHQFEVWGHWWRCQASVGLLLTLDADEWSVTWYDVTFMWFTSWTRSPLKHEVNIQNLISSEIFWKCNNSLQSSCWC